MQPLIDTVAIIKSTEPEFSVVSEETEADATDHFDVTINLLECLSKEVSFEQKDHPESIALHESFYSLLTMLEQCTRSHRYVAKLTISEDNITYRPSTFFSDDINKTRVAVFVPSGM